MAKTSQLKQRIDKFLNNDLMDEELSCEFLHQDVVENEPINTFALFAMD